MEEKAQVQLKKDAKNDKNYYISVLPVLQKGTN